MKKYPKGFMLGAATAAHQVEGNNIHSDYWVQEQIPHSVFVERLWMQWITITAMRRISVCWRKQD